MSILNEFIDEILSERTTNLSTIRRNKMDKRNALAKRSALSICEEENPALYQKYHFYREKMLETREKIYKKYGQRGKIFAKRKLV